MRNVIIGLAALPAIGAVTIAALGALGIRPRPSLADEGRMPDLGGAIGWLNSAPLTRESLRGKVVLVDFWTYTCINSLRPRDLDRDCLFSRSVRIDVAFDSGFGGRAWSAARASVRGPRSRHPQG